MQATILIVAILLIGPASAQSPDISAQRLLSSWKGEDPGMRLVAEVIASAFSSDLSWRGSLAGLEKFVEDNPDMADRPYGDAMAATLSRAFPCRAL